MTMLTRLLIAALLATMLSLAAWSYPTIYGETGLIQVPIADVVPVFDLQTSVDFAQVKSDAADFNIYPIRFTYGIGDRTEMFVNLAESSGKDNDTIMAVGGKLLIMKENLEKKGPGLAAGFRLSRAENGERLDTMEGYLTFSKVLFSRGDLISEGYSVRFTAGGSYISYTGALDDTVVSLFGGLSYRNLDGTTLVADFVPELKANGTTVRSAALSVAYRRPLSDNFWGEIGTTKAFNSQDNTLYAGLMYHFATVDVTEPRTDPILY